mgnify:CR=1 FL=1
MINSQSNFSSFSSRYLVSANPDVIAKSINAYLPKCTPIEKGASSEQAFHKQYGDDEKEAPHSFKNYSEGIVDMIVE